MSSQPTISKLGVTAEYRGAYSVESVRVRLGINTLAACTLVGIKDAKPIMPALAPAVMVEIKARQKARLAGRYEADCFVEISDGNGGKLNFDGYMTAPVLEISKNSIGDQMSVIAEDAMIDGLDLSIYTTGPQSLRAESEKGPLSRAYAAAEAGDVLGMLDGVTMAIMDSYETSLAAASSPSMKMLIEQQHNLNLKKPLDIWRGILGNGEAQFDMWQAACAVSKDVRRTLCERAGNALQQPSSGFWQTLNGLMAGFQLHYVPATDMSGKLMLSSSKVGPPTGNRVVHATSMTVTDGSLRIMQPGGVVMMAPSNSRLRAETNGRMDPGTIAGQYPAKLLDGYIHREPPPFWIVGPDGIPVVGMDAQAGQTQRSLNLSLEAYKKRLVAVDRGHSEIDDKLSSIMNELCRITYDQIRVADSTCTLAIPLDLTINVGERLTFELMNGVRFVGFIDNLMHSVDLTDGKRLNSFTQLGITHIEY